MHLFVDERGRAKIFWHIGHFSWLRAAFCRPVWEGEGGEGITTTILPYLHGRWERRNIMGGNEIRIERDGRNSKSGGTLGGCLGAAASIKRNGGFFFLFKAIFG